MARRRRMTDEDVLQTTRARVAECTGYLSSGLSAEREKALRYYRGDKFGDEIEGRSQIVSRDVAQYVDTVMPSLMRVFSSGDDVVRFNPERPGDEDAAKQRTDYVNHIWTQENEGFSNFYAWFLDGLLFKLGVIKIWWDDTPQRTNERYTGLTADALVLVEGDPDCELGEVTERLVMDPMSGMPMVVYDADVVKVDKTGRARVAPVPPEEFLFGVRAKSDADIGGALVHKRDDVTRSELIGMGYPRDVVDDLGLAGDGITGSSERIARFEDVDGNTSMSAMHDGEGATDLVEYVEAYLRLDRDGDGEAEYLQVCYSGSTLLGIEEVDDHPFAMVTPYPMPHRLAGLSMADKLMDVQEVNSAVQRQILDNLYLSNMPQMGAVDGQVNIDDLLTRRPGGIVRMKQPGALVPIATQPLGQEPYTFLEYMSSVAEQRTGATRYNQGLDANTLNKTATGINIIQNAAALRLELIARVYAETGVKRAFRRILALVCKHQSKPRDMKIRGEWVTMNPRGWREGTDMTVEVGLGNGNRDQVMAHMMALLKVDMEIVHLQGGVQGPLITAENVYQKLRKLGEAMGLKGVEAYYTDPSSVPPQEPKQDPKIEEAKAKLALQQAEAQSRMQLEMQDAQNRAALDQHAAEREAQLTRWKAEQEMELARWKAHQEAEVDVLKAHLAAEREAQKMAMRAQMAATMAMQGPVA